MATVLSQLKELRKQIKIPYRIQFVDHEILEEDFEDKVIYIYIWI